MRFINKSQAVPFSLRRRAFRQQLKVLKKKKIAKEKQYRLGCTIENQDNLNRDLKRSST